MGSGYTGSAIDRSYFQMSIPSAIWGSTILGATFKDEATNAETATSTSHTVTLYSSAGVTQGTTTWNDQPSWGGSPVSDTFSTASTTPDATESWDATARMQTDANDHSTQWTVALVNSSETSSAYWVAFSDNPTISITYDHAPATPSSIKLSSQYTTPSGAVYTATLHPGYYATATDPDGDELTYTFVTSQNCDLDR